MGMVSCPTIKIKIFWTRPKTSAPLARLPKNHRPCSFEGHFSTNPILSAFHLQGAKSNIYICSLSLSLCHSKVELNILVFLFYNIFVITF